MPDAASALVLVPLTLAGVLVVSAVAKLRARASTANAVRLLRLPGLLKPEWVAVALPPAEIVLAVGMLSPRLPAARAAAAAAFALFLAYWVVIARAMTFDPRPSCGCFGQIGDQRVTAKTLTRNTVLLAGAGVYVWMTWAQGATVGDFLAAATTREWLLVVGAAFAVLVAWFILAGGPVPATSPQARPEHPRAHLDRHGAATAAPADGDPDEDEYVRVAIPDAILLDPQHEPYTLLGLASQQPVLLVFITCGCPSTWETWSRLAGWAERLPQVRVLGVETYQLGDLDLPGVAERLFYDPLARTYEALGMPGTSSAILLGADGLVAGGPVLGVTAIEELVDEIAEALAEAAVSDPADEPVSLD